MRRIAVAVALVAAVLTGCGDAVAPIPPTVTGAVEPPKPAYEVVTRAPPTPRAPACDPRASSERPVGGLAPADQPRGPALERILQRGRLVVGVDQDTALFSLRGPDGNVHGIDVDIATEVARAIFGDPTRIEFITVGNDEREEAVLLRKVDMVVRTMTVTCDRLTRVAFSSVYFEAVQRVLVRRSPPGVAPAVRGPEDLAGRRTCVTRGSTSLGNVMALPGPHTVLMAQEWNDCLVLLREGDADAISTDHTILDGMAGSDPSTEIVGGNVSSEPYGIAVHPEDTDLVRAVNAALEDIRDSGTWARIYGTWLGDLGPVPPPPAARYRD